MQIKKLLQEDDAVSPVIGVILMVAITVILAAVIASFVLGLGGNQQQTPTASFSWDYEQEGTDGDLGYGATSVSHDGGDSIPAGELYFRGSGWDDGDASSGTYDTNSDDTTWAGATSLDDSSKVTGGQTVSLGVDSDYDISIIWEPQEGDTSATLSSETGPDA